MYGGKKYTIKNRKEKNRKEKNKKEKDKKDKKFQTLKCAPKLGYKHPENSCYSDEDLKLMKKIWNDNNPDNKNEENLPEKIWEFFYKNLNNKCYNELCWLNRKEFSSNINKNLYIKNIFRPFAPKSWLKKPYEWLSSIDILNVIKQYEKKFPNFVFIGPSPIDFDDKKLFGTCVWEKICKFNLKSYLNSSPKKTKIGIIFNLDPHYKDGSHWVALFIDLNKNFIFYFDSNGDSIPKRIKVLVDRVILQAKNLNIDLKYDTNKGMEHQKRDGQCGIYSLYFIIELLKEKLSPEYFKTNRIKDEEMKNYRSKYFNI